MLPSSIFTTLYCNWCVYLSISLLHLLDVFLPCLSPGFSTQKEVNKWVHYLLHPHTAGSAK